ncbi:hypothetical protein BC629DRAFT_1591222 [Irpex lacteus]|nr:hypothetical protein BC629DRAFT_1591222 [Irpex lacteus]
MAANDICLQCRQRSKRKDYQFCSKRCTTIAAKRAPQLLRVPKGHVMYNDVKKQFAKGWKEPWVPKPTIARIFLITWSARLRSEFDGYRAKVAKKRKMSQKRAEVKRFRAEARACRLGDSGKGKLCNLPKGSCRLCTAIRTGFKYSLEYKRNFVKQGRIDGVRYGGGLYMAPSSSKAYQYAKNEGKAGGSKLRAVLMARVVLGRPEQMYTGDVRKLSPRPGFDSVETHYMNEPVELVVYHKYAARPAYLLLLK